MNQAKVVRKEFAQDERQELAEDSKPNQIRPLEEYELCLAGGGDTTEGWP